MAENNQNKNIEEIYSLPLLPLRGLTVFPHMVLHFDVGRKVSVKALEQAMLNNQMIFLTAQKDINSESPKQGEVYKIGTIAKVKQLLRLPGDTIRVLVEGIKRAKILKFTQTEPYFTVEVKEIAQKNTRVRKVELEALMRQVIMNFENYAKLTNRIAPEIAASIETIEEPARLSDIVASNLFIKVDSKQELLSENNIKTRLTKLLEVMSKEIEILQIEREISLKVKKQIDKSQKEYYLREQLKAIQDELGEGENWNSEIEGYKERLALGGYPIEVEEKLIKELGRLKKMHSAAPEGSVIRTYIEWVLDLPWNKKTEEILSLELASNILEKDHYGLEKVKERIIEFLAVRKLKNSLKGPIICLAGPPGVGKTSIAKSVARALNRKYVRLSLGGVRDEAEIRGHRRTYVGAMPGRIINALKQAGTKNPLILLDEIDKMSSDFKGDPASAMLEVLDGEQNFSFRDHYLELPFDLSDVLFLTTANNLSTVPKPLLDRMEVIDISGYTEEEKYNIAEMYLIPKQIKEHGLLKRQLRFESAVVRDIINYYTREAGVRGLERNIAKVCRKAAKTIIAEDRKVITVSKKNLVNFLGIKRYHYDKACRIDEVGIARGLAWTPVGGDTLSIEVNLMKGEGKIELTGQLGDVMKESAKIAISYIRSRADELGIENDFYKNYDIHVHVPEGATPKDGPSAGITLATSLISALTGIPVKRCVAMTGEITLRGKVLPIGGVKEKVLAAHRAGITTIILPGENEKDISDIPETISKNLNFVIAENMECVLQTALTSMPIPILKEVSEMNNDKVAHNEKCQDNIQSDASITGITPKTTVIKQ